VAIKDTAVHTLSSLLSGCFKGQVTVWILQILLKNYRNSPVVLALAFILYMNLSHRTVDLNVTHDVL